MKTKIGYFLLLWIMIFSIAAAPLTVYAEGGGGAVRPPADESVIDTVGGFIHGEALIEADSYEQALGYANAYRAELKSYAFGVAVLIVEDAEQAVAKSASMRTANLPKLSLNRLYTIYDDSADLKYKEVVKSRNTYSSPEMSYGYYRDNIPEANSSPYTHLPDNFAEVDRKTYGEPHSVQVSAGQWHHEEMNNERAWAISTGRGVTVAVIDTGIDITHPKFAGRISQKSYNSYTDEAGIEYVQDDDGHGTHVSGIVAASTTGDTYVRGVAPDAEILAIKANIPEAPNYFDTASIVRGINYADETGADIINMSLGNHYYGGSDELERNAIVNAVKNGVIIICAAGNESFYHAGYPAANPETIAVSALRQGGYFDEEYSNYGPEIDISAPGTDIYSTSNGGGYEYMTGTSMASPNVAGTAALVKAIHPEYSQEQMRAVLCGTARKAEDMATNKDKYYGYGIVNSYAALQVNSLYKVTFDFNYAGSEAVVMYAVPNTKLAEPEWLARDGYIFDGWYTSASGGNLFDFNSAINGNLTLFAHWTKLATGMYAYEFPDINFRREVLRVLNESDGGNRLSSSIITSDDYKVMAGIGELHIDWMDIRKLKGIEYFTGVEIIDCGFNLLTEIDLSKNTALKELYCGMNQLTQLDVSKNIKLISLHCYGNLLTDLNLQKNTALKILDCSNNQLTELFVSNNKGLEQLLCYYNQLSELDLSKNIALENLYCFGNELTELNVRNNINLTVLNCSGNPLSMLDVSNNKALEMLRCDKTNIKSLDASNNINLTSLWCNENDEMTTLDVSKNIRLTELVCEYNSLTKLDVSQNTELRLLAFSFNRLMAVDVSKNTELEDLWNVGNYMKGMDVSKNTSLTWLVCNDNYMKSPDDVKGWRLSPGLVLDDTFIFYPQFDGEPPTGKNITASFTDTNFLAEVRKVTGKLTGPIYDYDVARISSLYLYNRSIRNLSGIEYFIALQDLYCSDNRLTQLDLSKNTVLKYLHCDNNQLNVLDVSKNTALISLGCFNNKLTQLNLSKNVALSYLNCGNNRLNTLDVSKNTELVDISCSYNDLMKLDVSKNTALSYFYIGHNQLNMLDVSKNIDLEVLYCNNNELPGLDISKNKKLIYLDCRNNNMASPDRVTGWRDLFSEPDNEYFGFYPQNTGTFVLGDVNDDGVITTADAVMVLQHIAKIIALDDNEFRAADVNQDNLITTADAVMVLQYIAKIIPSFT